MRCLFDVNMLLALLDGAHVHHAKAREWLSMQPSQEWASCPITQNGFVRIISQPAYPSPISVSEAVSLISSAASTSLHEFWPDDLSLFDDGLIDHSRIHGPKQLTDVYLLALAVKHGGRLVALDKSIALSAARSAKSINLVLV